MNLPYTSLIWTYIKGLALSGIDSQLQLPLSVEIPVVTRYRLLTIFWSMKLDIELADVVLDELNFPIRHH